MTTITFQEAAEIVLSSGLFDHEFYSSRYMGGPASPEVAVQDFLSFSGFDQRSPSAGFDALQYARQHWRALGGRAIPLLHYIVHGRNMGIRLDSVSDRGRDEIPTDEAFPDFAARLAIHLHLYYVDALSALETRFAAFPAPADVFISVPEGAPVAEIEARLRPHLHGNLSIATVPNRGRNFAPLFVTFAKALREYDFVGHIHTKKSLYSGQEQLLWRDHLWSGVLGSPGVVNRIFRAFAGNSDLLLISSDRFPGMPYWANHWLQNSEHANLLAARLNLPNPLVNFVDYPVGGMFWARRQLLERFFDLNLTYEDFPIESGETDGALHHALERLVGEAARQLGSYAAYSPQRGGIAYERDTWIQDYATASRPGLEEVMANYDVVSFDFFDTLVTRNAASTETAKRRVAERHRDSLGFDYETLRNQAERTVREAKGWAGDVTTREIAERLAEIGGIDLEKSISLVSEEFQWDLRLLQPRSPIVEVYNFARESGKRVILVSDTFYSEECIARMLEKCGISQPDKLYISSELGARKDRGDLWQMVKAEEADWKLLHIGDNAVSDVQRPSDAGLQGVLVLSAHEKCEARGVLRRRPTESEWPLVRGIVKALGDDPFFG